MRNFLLKTVFATFCFSLVFAFLSCDGIAQKIDRGGGQDTESEQEFIITGTLSVDGAVPSEIAENNLAYAEKSAENESENAKIAESKNARSVFGDFESGASSFGRSARTAIPSIPSSTTYTVTATSGGKTEFGEVNGNSFTIKLSSVANETWAVKVEGFSDSSMAANTKILEGTSGSFQINTNSVKNDISITLSPISSGSGKIDLTVNFENGTGINNVEMILTKAGSNQQTITGSGSTPVRLNETNIPAGVYNAEINFKSSSGELKYSTHEVINVLPNFTTDTWQGNSTYLTKTDGKTEFKITKTLVDDFSKNIDDKIFYVAGTNPSFTVNANDNNVGTNPFLPLATLQKAVDKVIAINDETSDYKIIVDGTLEITSDTASSAVIIQPTKPLTLTIEGVNASNKATVKAKSTGDMRVFIVGNGGNTSITPNVTMKNLIITGGRNESGGGAGIKLEAGNLTLSNVEVTSNSTTDIGGGICVGGNASITLNDGTEISNNSADSGGGIYIESGTCTINGGTISNNSAESNGGGIYVGGGTLTINGTVTMSGNQLTGQQETGTAIFVGRGATAELDGSSGNISITQGIAQGGALPTIYLEKGIPGSISSGGSGGSSAIPDAVLKLGGNIQIGNGNSTGIKMEKTFRDTANIKITSKLTSTQIINISYDDAQRDDNPIIESEESWQLTQEDCDKFIVTNGNSTYKLTYDGSKNQGICANAN